jgi:hypothetical protein
VTAREISTVAGLPVTTPERIVVDLLADHHDGEHIAGVLAAVVRARTSDLAKLARRLGPFASRFGLPASNGGEVLEHLLDVGGSSNLTAANDLRQAADRRPRSEKMAR